MFYRDRDDYDPLAEYLDELSKKAITSKNERVKLKKIVEYLELLEKHGTRLGEPYVKHIEGDIWELRPLSNRIFFFFLKDGKLIMLHHFIKKTKKTPPREIEQAKRNQKDFLERGFVNEERKY
jgi:phage-related protein